jgi:hypothetical protein
MPFLVNQTFKIVEDISRNLIQATKTKKEDLSTVFDRRKTDSQF